MAVKSIMKGKTMFTIHYLQAGLPKKITVAILLNDESDGKKALFIGAKKGGQFDVLSMPSPEFKKLYVEVMERRGHQHYEPINATDVVQALVLTAGTKFSTAALDKIEEILEMDTRGKSSEEIRKEVERLAVDLPKGHALRTVPKSYPDRGQAIAAYTAIRQELFKLNVTPTQESTTMATKKAGKTAEAAAPAAKTKKEIAAEAKAAAATAATEKKAADAKAKVDAKTAKGANGDAAKVAAEADAKGGAKKAKADFTGKYLAGGKAATVKSTEELGMHAESARTKILAHVMASKAKSGVDYSALEGVAGEQTRGAVANLVKKGLLVRAGAAA